MYCYDNSLKPIKIHKYSYKTYKTFKKQSTHGLFFYESKIFSPNQKHRTKRPNHSKFCTTPLLK